MAQTNSRTSFNSKKRELAITRVASLRLSRERSRAESGSILPLGIGLFLVGIGLFIMSVDIFFLRSTKLDLERIGETLIADSFQKIAYDRFFLGSISDSENEGRSFVPFDCADVIAELQNRLQYLKREFPNVNVVWTSCSSSKLRIIVESRVELPFQPPFLGSLQPVVKAIISGGVQRIQFE